MARVALVTGGTRGIGAAISKALKAAGHTVVANYGGNDEAANKFKGETGIPVTKFDVSDAGACESGIKAIEGEQALSREPERSHNGPDDRLVQAAAVAICHACSASALKSRRAAGDEVALKVERVVDRSMGGQEPLG